jgi:hypothetical protein
LSFNGLHDFISQKTELFITTGVRTSNPTRRKINKEEGNIWSKKEINRRKMHVTNKGSVQIITMKAMSDG